MADVITRDGKTLMEMDKEITCAVCQDHYTEPKVLPCLHYYCKECVLKLALRTPSKPFSCPECRKDTILPEGGVEELKTAFFVNRYKSNYYALERVHSKVEVKCEGCSDSGAKAEAFCRQCVAFICKECVRQHKKLKAFRSHEVDSLDDLKQGRAKEIAAKEPPTKKCLTHEEPLIIYCFDCNSLICRDCTVVAHKDHKFEFSKVAAPDIKTKLLEQLSPLKTAAKTLSGAVIEIQTTNQEVETQGNSVTDTINTSFNQLQLILEKRKQQLLQESAKIVQEKIDKLTVQEKNLSLAHAEVQSITDYTERFVSDCSDNEVMSMHTEFKKRIEQEMEQQSQSGRNTEPVEEAYMGVEVGCVETLLQQLCQTKAKITRLAIDPTQCTLSTDNAESSLIDQSTTVALTTKLSNGKTTRRNCVITAQLKSLCNGSDIKCEVKRSKKTGEYLIQYTPTVRGRHELSVIIDGKQQVAGSPFTMSVYVYPTRLGKPVKVWTGLNVSTNITVKSTGEILVNELSGDIVKLCKDGKKQVLVKRDLHGLTKVWDLATDSKDNIYCVSNSTNHIMKCNQSGGDIQVKKVDQSNNRGYSELAIIDNEVWLRGIHSGHLIVCDRNLNYKKCIKNEEHFIAVCSDVHGNIYATSRNNMIHVISKDGAILRSFGCDSNGVKMLNGPRGICVSGQFVYVTNYDSHNVSVFTTAGDFVTSLRGHGSGDGELRKPLGVCTDLDNFVYILDNFIRVQCF